MKEFKSLYTRFLQTRPQELHFAAHSHHFWPDVTREAQLQAWDDAARYNDRKWEHIFTHVVPRVQKHIASILNLKHTEMIALAPNTHDLLTRLFSELLLKPELKLLTTDSEFHSFGRQLKRWEEAHSHLKVTRVSTEILLTDRAQFLSDIKTKLAGQDVVFLSQVFFNSGLTLADAEFKELVKATPATTVFIIDGYHGFGAVPFDLSSLEGRVFYLGGGYKYAQGGEGVGFMVVPKGEWRPVLTGWFAEFAHLSGPQTSVRYSQDGMAFWGSTLEPSGWYRFNATWDQFEKLSVKVSDIHQYVLELQRHFLSRPAPLLSKLRPLFNSTLEHHGHFLTYEASTLEAANQTRETLSQRGIYIDQRGQRLRFGFGLYQDKTDIERLLGLLT